MDVKDVKDVFSAEVVQDIAKFFADKYNSPQLAFSLVSCGGGSSCSSYNSCCCSCAGPSDSDGM